MKIDSIDWDWVSVKIEELWLELDVSFIWVEVSVDCVKAKLLKIVDSNVWELSLVTADVSFIWVEVSVESKINE